MLTGPAEFRKAAPGQYHLGIDVDGFKTYRGEIFSLASGEIKRISIIMSLGDYRIDRVAGHKRSGSILRRRLAGGQSLKNDRFNFKNRSAPVGNMTSHYFLRSISGLTTGGTPGTSQQRRLTFGTGFSF